MGFAAAAAVPVSLGRAADIDRILQAADDVEEGHDPNVARIRKPPASPFLSPSRSPLQGVFAVTDLGNWGVSGLRGRRCCGVFHFFNAGHSLPGVELCCCYFGRRFTELNFDAVTGTK